MYCIQHSQTQGGIKRKIEEMEAKWDFIFEENINIH